jgi:hypothetical protein
LLSVKINKIEILRSNLHKKIRSVDVSMMNAKKKTASIIYAEHAFASTKIERMLKRNKAAMEQECNGNKVTIVLKDSLLAKKDGEIKNLKATVTQLQMSQETSIKKLRLAQDSQIVELKSKHEAKRCKQADIINHKNDSMKERTHLHEKTICEMDDWMAEVNKEKESAVSVLIKSKEKLLTSKKAADGLKAQLNRKEEKLITPKKLSVSMQRRCEQLERSLVELDMEKSEYIAELEHIAHKQ